MLTQEFVPKTGADAKTAQAHVWVFQQTDLLMALARSALAAVKDNASADAKADVSRLNRRRATTAVARHFFFARSLNSLFPHWYKGGRDELPM